MKRFLSLLLFAGLVSPITAKADDYKVRHTCGQVIAGFITPTEAHKRLGLPKISSSRFEQETKNFSERDFIDQIMMIDRYCKGYTGHSDVSTL